MSEPLDFVKVGTFTSTANAKAEEVIVSATANASTSEERYALLAALQAATVAWMARLAGAELVAGQLTGMSEALLAAKSDLSNPHRH